MTSANPVPVRRSSIVGPLILLLLGVVFLVANLRPDLSVWRLFANYWPYLLIVWGAARLVEYALARMAGRPIARALTGGEVFLAIVICLAGNALWSVESGRWTFVRFRGFEFLTENYEFAIQASRPVPPGAAIVIHSGYGDVKIAGGDAQELQINGQKRIRALDRSSAEEADRSTPVEIVEEGGNIVVRTPRESAGAHRVSADLVIVVPKTAAVTIEGRSGDIEAREVSGPVEIQSANAGVRLSNIEKQVKLNLRRSDSVQIRQVKGAVQITGRGRDLELQDIAGAVTIDGGFSGNIQMQNLSKPVRYTSSQTELAIERLPGKLEMDLGSLTATEVTGPFRLTAHNKDVRVEEFTGNLEVTARRGDIFVATSRIPLGNVRVENSNGNIALEVPGNARFQIEASTANGNVHNDFGTIIRVSEKERAAEMTGGSGGAQIRLSTRRGDITLRKLSQTQSL